MSYPHGLDYAGGHIAGASLKRAGVAFVCRYITDGGSELPNKLMTRAEADDLRAHGIEIVSNWESYADRMRGGYAAGQADARAANATHLELGGPPNAPIYFSCDYDEPERDQPAINEYLRACGDVLGGPQRVGIYGGYWSLSRALNAGVCYYAWQTEAWSGGNVDSRVHIFQRNRRGYQYIDGVECDINEAHTDDWGQWSKADVVPAPPSVQRVAIKLTADDLLKLIYEQLCGPIDPKTGYGRGWPQLGQNEKGDDLYLFEAVARLLKTVDGRKKPAATTRKKTPNGGTRSTSGKKDGRSP